MVIVGSGMVCGRIHLVTTSPQHGGHSHLVGGLKPNEALFFAHFSRLAAATQPTASSLQQSTVFAEETVWKTFLSALFIAFLEEKFSSYKFSSIFGGP